MLCISFTLTSCGSQFVRLEESSTGRQLVLQTALKFIQVFLTVPTWSHVWLLTQYGHRFVTCFRKRDYFTWVIFYSSCFTPCCFTLSLTMFHLGSSSSWLFTRAVQYPVAVDRALIFQWNSTPELSWRHSQQSCSVLQNSVQQCVWHSGWILIDWSCSQYGY